MLSKRITAIETAFEVSFIDYANPGRGVLISSGCGIGMAIMDLTPTLRFFLDTDSYRHRTDIDWEALSVVLTSETQSKPDYIILSGWFSLDPPEIFDRIERGILETQLFRYEGGKDVSLSAFLNRIHSKR